MNLAVKPVHVNGEVHLSDLWRWADVILDALVAKTTTLPSLVGISYRRTMATP
ncbi:hypothetical protein AWENTII_011930 [Aspergillus wentii]